MPKNLKAQELKELEGWLLTHKIAINNRTRRDYSDVGPIALLIKKFNNKIIDMINYPSRSSFALKLANWETFNRKVLNKLNLHQSKITLENLAQGNNGAIECLLYELMVWHRFHLAKKNAMVNIKSRTNSSLKSNNSTTINDINIINNNNNNNILNTEPLGIDDDKRSVAIDGKDVISVDVERIQNGNIIRVTMRMVELELYERICRQICEKDKFINSLKQKCSYLESVIKLKEDRINDLTEQLTRLSVSTLSKMHNLDDDSSEDCWTSQLKYIVNNEKIQIAAQQS